jgi:hypothetical protein
MEKDTGLHGYSFRLFQMLLGTLIEATQRTWALPIPLRMTKLYSRSPKLVQSRYQHNILVSFEFPKLFTYLEVELCFTF